MTTTVKVITAGHPASVSVGKNWETKDADGRVVARGWQQSDSFIEAGREAHFHISQGDNIHVSELAEGATALPSHCGVGAISTETTEEPKED